jgi:Bacterial Ig-like domain (group 2)
MVGSPHWTLKGSTVVALLCTILLMSSCAFSPPSNHHPTLVSIAVTAPSLSMAKGTSEQFTATGTYSDQTTQNLTSSVTWRSQNTGVATVTAGGSVTAAGAGTSTIQAVSGTVMGSATLTVTSATLVSIAETPSNFSIAKGTTEQFTATGIFSDNSTQNLTSSVTWSSQTMNVAMITAGGLAMGLTPGTTKIEAASGSVSGSTTLTVTSATLVSIAVTAPNFSIAKGISEQLTATGTFSDSSTQNLTSSVTWSSQNTGTVTITAGGLATAVATGTSMIQAVSGAISGSTTLTVTPATLVSIAVSATSLSIAKGTSEQFTATGTYSDGSTQNITASVTWSSLTTSVATITTGGMVTAVGTGTSSIQAVSGAISGSTTLIVTAPMLVSIAVTPANPTIGSTGTEQFTATGKYTDSSTQNLTTMVTWSSSQTNIATISNIAGTNGRATAVANGTTTIQAMLGSVQGSTVLTVSAITLQVIVVSPQNPTISDNGATQGFTATGHYSDGSTQNLTSSATWTSSNTSVASVSVAGVATSATLGSGVNAAFTSIQATVGSTKGVSILSVTNHTSNSGGFAGVFTQHNDIGRTGQNLSESALTPTNVNTATFGKLFAQSVDGYIYAQPLYVPNVTIGGSTHNVIYVATEGDSVYAFDADSNTGTNAGLLWHASLIDTAHGAAAGATTVNIQQDLDSGCTDLVPQVGITSTPVIDPSSGTMYVEAKSKENGNYIHRLHAIDITTGVEKTPGPMVITASVPGDGQGSSGGVVSLDGLHHLNRVGLLLLNGTIYIGYASHCDTQPYHGWQLAYDAGTFTQTALLVTTANGIEGGFWMAGAGVAGDSNANIFIASGNGDFDTTHVPAQELGDTIMKLFNLNSSTLSLVDYFTPYDQSTLDGEDGDVGSGGVLLLPDQPGGVTHELVEAGKEGSIYLIDRDQMTAGNLHYCQTTCGTYPNGTDTQITQEIKNQIHGLWSIPAYFNNTVYFCGAGDNLKGFPMSSGLLAASPSETSSHSFGFPGCTPVASGSGNTNGIIWVVDTSTYGNAGASLGPAVLYAYQPGTTATMLMLWNSSQTGIDTAGNAVKFAVPTIANGKVYIGTQTELDVYGLRP